MNRPNPLPDDSWDRMGTPTQRSALQRLSDGLWRAVWAGHQQSPALSKVLDFVGLGCGGSVLYKPAQGAVAALEAVPARRLNLNAADPVEVAVFACSVWQEECHGCPWRQGIDALLARRSLRPEPQPQTRPAQTQVDGIKADFMCAEVGHLEAQAQRLAVDHGHLGHHPQPRALGMPHQPGIDHAEHGAKNGNAQRHVVQHGFGVCSHGGTVAQRGGAAVATLTAVLAVAAFFVLVHLADRDADTASRMAAINAELDAADARLQRAATQLCQAEAGPGAQVLWTHDGDLVCRPAVVTAQVDGGAR